MTTDGEKGGPDLVFQGLSPLFCEKCQAPLGAAVLKLAELHKAHFLAEARKFGQIALEIRNSVNRRRQWLTEQLADTWEPDQRAWLDLQLQECAHLHDLGQTIEVELGLAGIVLQFDKEALDDPPAEV